jgi:hypothetical protein
VQAERPGVVRLGETGVRCRYLNHCCLSWVDPVSEGLELLEGLEAPMEQEERRANQLFSSALPLHHSSYCYYSSSLVPELWVRLELLEQPQAFFEVCHHRHYYCCLLVLPVWVLAWAWRRVGVRKVRVRVRARA